MTSKTANKTTYVPSGFLLRDHIAAIFDDKIVEIADHILENRIPFRCPGLEASQSDLATLYNVIGEFIDLDEIEATETELDLFIRWLEFQCVLREGIRAGYIREMEPGLLKITPDQTEVSMLLDGPLADSKVEDMLEEDPGVA